MKNKFMLILTILANITTLNLVATDTMIITDESPLSAERCATIAHYHFEETKCYRKAMSWALKGAQSGSSDCMLMLRNAYGRGYGVIKETEESLKWLLLAAATGNNEARDQLEDLELLKIKVISLVPDNRVLDHMNTQWSEAAKRAKDWIKLHPDTFINEN